MTPNQPDSSLSAEEEAELRAAGPFVGLDLDGWADHWKARLLATLDAEREASAARIAVLEGALRAVTNEAEYYVRASGHDYDAGLDEAVTAARAALRSPATEAPTLAAAPDLDVETLARAIRETTWDAIHDTLNPASAATLAHDFAARIAATYARLRSEPIAKTEAAPSLTEQMIQDTKRASLRARLSGFSGPLPTTTHEKEPHP